MKVNSLSKYPFFLITALITGVLINYFVLGYEFGLGIFLFNIFMIGIYEIYRYVSDKDNFVNRYQLLIIPIIVFSGAYFFRSDEFVLGLDTLLLLILIPLYTILVSNSKFFDTYSIFETLSILNAFGFVNNIFAPVSTWLKTKFDGKFFHSLSRTLIKILIALAITVPVFFIVLIILSEADSIFSQYINITFDSIFRYLINFDTVSKFLLSLTFGYVIWTYLSGFIIQRGRLTPMKLDPNINKKFQDVIIPGFLVYSLNIIYLGFVIVQFGYLFGGESYTKQYGVVFSEYAIKGFWEMFTVIIINFVVLYFVQTKFSLKENMNKIFLIPAYIFTALASIVMVISSYSRIMVYVSGYGFTRDRLTPLLFLVFAMMMLIMFLINNFVSDDNRKKFLKLATVAIVLSFMSGFTFFSMDKFIVDENLKSHPSVTYEYLIGNTNAEGKISLLDYRASGKVSSYDQLDFDNALRGSISLKKLDWQSNNVPNMLMENKYREVYVYPGAD